MKKETKKIYQVLLAAVAVAFGLSAGLLAATVDASAEEGTEQKHYCYGSQYPSVKAIENGENILDSEDSIHGSKGMLGTHAHTWYLKEDITNATLKISGDCEGCKGKTVIQICLNSYTLDLGDSSLQLGDRVDFAVQDCSGGKGVLKADGDIIIAGSDSRAWVSRGRLYSSGGDCIVMEGGGIVTGAVNSVLESAGGVVIKNSSSKDTDNSSSITIKDSTLTGGKGSPAVDIGKARHDDSIQLSGKVKLDGGEGVADIRLMNNKPVILGNQTPDPESRQNPYEPPTFVFLPLSGDSEYVVETSNLPDRKEKVVLVAEPYTCYEEGSNLNGRTMPLTKALEDTFRYVADDSNIHVYLKDNKIYAAYKEVIDQLEDIDEYMPIDEDGDTDIDYFIPEDLFPEEDYYPVDMDDDGQIDHYVPKEVLKDEDGDGTYTPEGKDKPEYILIDEDGDGDIDKAVIKDEIDLDNYVPIDKDGDIDVDYHVPEEAFDKDDYIPVDKDNDGKIDHYVPEGILQDGDGDGTYTPKNLGEPEYIMIDEDGDGGIDKAVIKDEIDLDDYVPVDMDNDGKPEHHVPDGVLVDGDGDSIYTPKGKNSPEYTAVDESNDGKPEMFVLGAGKGNNNDGSGAGNGNSNDGNSNDGNNNDGNGAGNGNSNDGEEHKIEDSTSTGDSMDILPWLALATTAAAVGLGTLTVCRRKS